jgi:hypothetical protein
MGDCLGRTAVVEGGQERKRMEVSFVYTYEDSILKPNKKEEKRVGEMET